MILNISASPFWQDKQNVRQEMLAALAKRHGAIVAMVNQVGGNDSLIFDGASIVLGPDGALVAKGASFAEDLVVFDTEALGAADLTADDETKAAWDGLVLGTRDYVRKCGFSKALVGLSGRDRLCAGGGDCSRCAGGGERDGSGDAKRVLV